MVVLSISSNHSAGRETLIKVVRSRHPWPRSSTFVVDGAMPFVLFMEMSVNRQCLSFPKVRNRDLNKNIPLSCQRLSRMYSLHDMLDEAHLDE